VAEKEKRDPSFYNLARLREGKIRYGLEKRIGCSDGTTRRTPLNEEGSAYGHKSQKFGEGAISGRRG